MVKETKKPSNQIVNPDDDVVEQVSNEDVVTLPRSVMEGATLVVKPEKVIKVKEKKPRSEAQLAATARMREALAIRRSEGVREYGATVHSDEYKKSLDDAQEVADKLTLTTGIKTVVKKPAGRPKGSRVVKEAPTPYAPSDEEEEEEEIPPLVKQAIRNIIKQQNAPVAKPRVKTPAPPPRQLSYLERLNLHLV
jgi:hypothetical protein